MEVVCGPRVLVVVHRRRKDHGKDLKLSQPMLEGEGEEEKKKRMERWKTWGVREQGEVKIREEGDIKRHI